MIERAIPASEKYVYLGGGGTGLQREGHREMWNERAGLVRLRSSGEKLEEVCAPLERRAAESFGEGKLFGRLLRCHLRVHRGGEWVVVWEVVL